jgi:hypothetical protein
MTQAAPIIGEIMPQHHWGDPQYPFEGFVEKPCTRCPVIKTTRVADGARTWRLINGRHQPWPLLPPCRPGATT